MFVFKLPDLGEGIHEGEILKWYAAIGETIGEDDPLVDIETDKAAVTIPSPRGGKIVSLGGDIGDTIEVGKTLVTIDDGNAASSGGEQEKDHSARTSEAEPAPASATPALPPQPAPTPPSGSPVRVGPVPAAPATRRKAREMNIDLHLVPGSGPGGRVSVEDLFRYAKGDAPAPAIEAGGHHTAATTIGGATSIPFFELEPLPDFRRYGEIETQPVRSIRRKVARKMTSAMILVPHVALMEEIDVSELEAFRRRERTRREGQPGGRLSLLSFVVKATTQCLLDFPAFNASLDHFKCEIIYKKYTNIGFAADTPRGLMVPVIKGSDGLSILEISAEIERLAKLAREKRITVEELSGGTFTITNVGPIGGQNLIPTINHPEVAILGMGRAEKRAIVRNDEIVIRTMLPITLTFDHRVADGADAARFVQKLKTLLSEPLNWLLEL